MNVHAGYPLPWLCAPLSRTFTSPRSPTSTVVCVGCVCRAAAGPELPRCCLSDMRATHGCQIWSEEDISPGSWADEICNLPHHELLTRLDSVILGVTRLAGVKVIGPPSCYQIQYVLVSIGESDSTRDSLRCEGEREDVRFSVVKGRESIVKTAELDRIPTCRFCSGPVEDPLHVTYMGLWGSLTQFVCRLEGPPLPPTDIIHLVIALSEALVSQKAVLPMMGRSGLEFLSDTLRISICRLLGSNQRWLVVVKCCTLHVVLWLHVDVRQERRHSDLIQGVESFSTDRLKRTNTNEKIVLPNAEAIQSDRCQLLAWGYIRDYLV
uniref:Uncharacterized protein n=1 Tax=Timema bartmani TaxID=61472 RepID=A0A7R9HYT9_9NEOP|nr:unnamed protein product [Timema bartmani]